MITVQNGSITELNETFLFTRNAETALSSPFDEIYPRTVNKADFLDALNLDLPSMSAVKTAYDAGDIEDALAAAGCSGQPIERH